MWTSTTTTVPYDMEFLLRAAPLSENAKAALDVVADTIRMTAEKQRDIVRERLAKVNVAEKAAEADESGDPI